MSLHPTPGDAPIIRPLAFHGADDLVDLLFGRDLLRNAVREINGIPDADYVVTHGRVFVFEKLVDLVEQRIGREIPQWRHGQILEMARECLVTPDEAVTQWSISPWPYTLRQYSRDGNYFIHHPPLRASVPGSFGTEQAGRAAMARLLAGEPVGGEGDFIHHGQPLLFDAPLDMSSVPPSPFAGPAPAGTNAYVRLAGMEHVPGFQPLPRALFERVREVEEQIAAHSAASARQVYSDPARLLALLRRVPLDTLRIGDSDPFAGTRTGGDIGDEVHEELRIIAPETRAHLRWLYNTAGWANLVGTPEVPDEGFVCYVIGYLIGPGWGIRPRELGEIAAHAMLTGADFDEAARFARQWDRHDSSVRELADRVADALRFLVEDARRNNVLGNPVSTLFERLSGAVTSL